MVATIRLRLLPALFVLMWAPGFDAAANTSLLDIAPYPDAPGRDRPGLSEDADRGARAMAHWSAGLLLEEDSPEASGQHLQSSFDLDPGNVDLALRLAESHLEREETSEALSVLKDALKRRPQSQTLLLSIARIYLVNLGKSEQAQRYATQAVQSAPDSIEGYQMLYNVHRFAGQERRATQVLEKAATRKTKDPAFWAGLGDLWGRKQSLAHYRKAVELGWDDPAILSRAMDYFAGTNHTAETIRTARRLLALQPSDTVNRHRLALALAAEQRHDEATAVFEQLLGEQPANAVLYQQYAAVLTARGDLAGALLKWEKALLLDASDPRAYVEAADLCLRLGRYDDGVRWLGEARGKFSLLPILPYYEARVLAALRRYPEALNAANLASRLARRYQPEFLTAEVLFEHAAIAERCGEHAQAEQLLQECLRLDPKHPQALNYLGYMWAEQGVNLPEAEKLVRRALAVQPDNPAFLDSLGWVLHRQNRHAEALEPLQRAAALSKEPDPVILEHLGDVQHKLGQVPAALAAWEKAAALEGASAALPRKIEAARSASANAGGGR